MLTHPDRSTRSGATNQEFVMHFCTLVFAYDEDHVEELLAPYCEQLSRPRLRYTSDELAEIGFNAVDSDLRDQFDHKGLIEQGLIYLGYDEDYIAENLTEEGLLSTYNDQGKWDWYELGGRFSDLADDVNDKDVEELQDFDWGDRIPFAFVTPDSKWHERGHVSSVSVDCNDYEAWKKEFLKVFETIDSDYCCYVVDCHI